MDRSEIVKVWTSALASPDDAHRDAVAAVLAGDVTSVSPLGQSEGRDAVLASVGQSPLAAMFAQAKWSDPSCEQDVCSTTCTFPAGAPVGGVTVRITIDAGGKIRKVDTSIIPAPPPTPKPVHLTDTMREAVNGALLAGKPVVVAYVDPEGRPKISPRGTAQVHNDDQLAIWIRNPEGGLPAAIQENQNLALFYRDPTTRTTYHFQGRAHASDAADVREKVYTRSPEPERNFDPQRRGIAVVVDIDRVEGRDSSGPVLMVRDA